MEENITKAELAECSSYIQKCRGEASKRLVGQKEIIDGMLMALISGGHVLLEAMAEGQVTIGENTYALPEPFFVLATENPIEQEGTYGLPEAELDRFLLKLHVPYPTPEEEIDIVKTGGKAMEVPVEKVFDESSLKKCRNAVEAITADDKILEYIVSIVNVTRPDQSRKDFERRTAGSSSRKKDILHYIAFGASPRAGIALLKCAKVQALFSNRSFVLPEDVQSVAKNVLRHRLVLNYEASADGITSDDLISKIVELLPVP